MSLEGFSKKGMELGDNPEGIRETINDLKKQYINTIRRLALQKMKNDMLFEGNLGATIRRFSSLGLNVTRESILKDIQNEIHKNLNFTDIADEIEEHIKFIDDETLVTAPSFDSASKKETDTDVISETDEQIKNLKENLGALFGNDSTQEQKPVNISSTLPREPAMQSPKSYETIVNNNSPQTNQTSSEQTQANNEKDVSEQLRQAQEEIGQKLEWAKQQPNKPTMTFTGDLNNLSNDVKQKIIQQIESRGEVKVSEIEKVYQEGNYIVVDAKQINGNFVGVDFTLDDFVKLVNQPSIVTKTEEVLQQSADNRIESQVQEQSQLNEEESIEKQAKDKIVNQIMDAMNKAGEFLLGDISMGERMSIMQNVQNKLNAKSMDELQLLLSTYQENTQEETRSSDMHR